MKGLMKGKVWEPFRGSETPGDGSKSAGDWDVLTGVSVEFNVHLLYVHLSVFCR